MLDPLRHFAVFEQSPAVHALSHKVGLPYLPVHLHEVLLAAVFYIAVYYLADPILRCRTKWYSKLSANKRAGVTIHVASQINALLMLVLAIPMFFEPALATPRERINMMRKAGGYTAEEACAAGIASMVAYDPYGAFCTSLISGYFVFDAYVTLMWFRDNGWGFAMHAFMAFFAFIQGCRPFMLTFGASFLWFEASTPFVNFHWLANNVPGLFSETAETLNGIALMGVFFACRIIAGPLNGYELFSVALTEELPNVPTRVVYVCFACYSLLTVLNFYWFGLMIQAAYRVLQKSGGATEVSDAVNKTIDKHHIE